MDLQTVEGDAALNAVKTADFAIALATVLVVAEKSAKNRQGEPNTYLESIT